MTFLTSGSGAIRAYEMRSMTDIKKSGQVELLSPLVTQTEGPFMMKHNDTYYLTYAGNHVKSTGYRIGYSYSEISPFDGFVYPANNSLALNTIGDFNGLGHSAAIHTESKAISEEFGERMKMDVQTPDKPERDEKICVHGFRERIPAIVSDCPAG